MKIPRNQVQYRKRIGSAGRKAVYGIGVVGGLHLVANDDGEILGMASHPLLARHLANRHQSDIVYTDMAKSETIDPRDFGHDIESHWAAETDAIRALQKGR